MAETAPIVFVHGLIGSLRSPDIHEPLRPWPTHAPDLLGYGVYRSVAADQITIDAQVEHVRGFILSHCNGRKVTLVGFSAGGVVCFTLADRYPALVSCIIAVESNFTLRDAAWSSVVAQMSPEEADAVIAGFLAEPQIWLNRFGTAPTPVHLAKADDWLARQEGRTVRAMAIALCSATREPEYLESVRRSFRQFPVHLVAGERSRAQWDVPSWASEEAASMSLINGAGHIMMLENPSGFGTAIAQIVAGADKRP